MIALSVVIAFLVLLVPPCGAQGSLEHQAWSGPRNYSVRAIR